MHKSTEFKFYGICDNTGKVDTNFAFQSLSTEKKRAILQILCDNEQFNKEKAGTEQNFKVVYLLNCQSTDNKIFTLQLSFNKRKSKVYTVDLEKKSSIAEKSAVGGFPKNRVVYMWFQNYLSFTSTGGKKVSDVMYHEEVNDIFPLLKIATDKTKSEEKKWKEIISVTTASSRKEGEPGNSLLNYYEFIYTTFAPYPDLLFCFPVFFAAATIREKEKKQIVESLTKLVSLLFKENKYDIDDVLERLVLRVVDPENLYELNFEKNKLHVPNTANLPRGYLDISLLAVSVIDVISRGKDTVQTLYKTLPLGHTPLHRAIMNGSQAVACALVKHYPAEALLAKDATGNSALHIASFYKLEEVVVAILERANTLNITASVVDQKNARDNTPAQCYHAKHQIDTPVSRSPVKKMAFRGTEIQEWGGSSRNLFTDHLLADLVINANASFEYPLKNYVLKRRKGTSVIFPKQDTVTTPTINFSNQSFITFSTEEKKPSGNSFGWFKESPYAKYIRRELFHRLKEKEKTTDSLIKEQITKAKNDLYGVVKDILLKDKPTKISDDLIRKINNSLIAKIKNDILKRPFIKQQDSLLAFFRGLLGVLISAILLFLPLASARYRHFFFCSSQEQIVRKGLMRLENYPKQQLVR